MGIQPLSKIRSNSRSQNNHFKREECLSCLQDGEGQTYDVPRKLFYWDTCEQVSHKEEACFKEQEFEQLQRELLGLVQTGASEILHNHRNNYKLPCEAPDAVAQSKVAKNCGGIGKSLLFQMQRVHPSLLPPTIRTTDAKLR